MKYSVISVTHSTGVSSKSNAPFSIARVIAVLPVELANSPKYQSVGAGFTPIEFDISDEFTPVLVDKFIKDFKGEAVVYDLDVLARQRGNAVVVGFSASAPVSLAPDIKPALAPVSAIPAANK